MNLSIKEFVENSTYFAYSKRGLFNRNKMSWSKWKEETYNNEEMYTSAERYTKQGLAWFRSTVGSDHTLFVLDFDIKLPMADIIIQSRLDQAQLMEDRRKRNDEHKNIETFRFDVHELAMQDFLSKAISKYPELLDFSWKFSGGVGRRHAMQKTPQYMDPKGFRPIFEHIAKNIDKNYYYHENDFCFEGDISYQNTIYKYIIKLDLAMTDPDRLIRGVYSPHFKDKIYRFSIPLPNSKLLDTDYIRDNCYKINRIESFDIKPFTYKKYYDKTIVEPTKKITKIKNFTMGERGATQQVSLDMGKIPNHIHYGVSNILRKLITLPCLDITKSQSHAPRTRFGNVATQRYTPEMLTAFFRDHVNDKAHNGNLHFSYYHLQRLKPNGVKGFGYWKCSTFQKPKNNFSIPKTECQKCPVYKKYQHTNDYKQSPWWVFSVIDNEYKEIHDKQQERTALRAELKTDIHDMIINRVQFNEIQAPVRTGKTKTMIDAITERSKTKRETVFFVGNIAGTKENIHDEATNAGYNGKVMEWSSKNDLCPLKIDSPNFIVTAGYCSSCPRKSKTDKLFEEEDFDHLMNHRWKIDKSPNKIHWMSNSDIIDDGSCNYYVMKKTITTELHRKYDNILLIADPRFIMQRDLIVTANPQTYDWIQLFDYIIYDEAHTIINVAYDTLVKNIDFIIKADNIDDWLNTIDPVGKVKRDLKGINALRNVQKVLKREASDLTIYKAREILEVSNAESDEILNQSTAPLQRYISEISHQNLDKQTELAITSLLDIINLHNWMIINHSGEDNWFDLFIFGKANKIYHKQRDVLATNYTLMLKSKLKEDKNDFSSITDIVFPILPLHHAKKVIFMSATPNLIANEILYFPTKLYSYFPRNQAHIIFGSGNTLTKKRVDRYQKHIIELVNGINRYTNKKVLLVSDNKKRLSTIIKNKDITIESYHPRDAKNAEGTTLHGFEVSVAINTSVQNIVSIENQSHIMAQIWDYDRTSIKMMFQQMSLARVVQAVARTMPYTDDATPATYILLDDRFVQSADKVLEWLSPEYEPEVALRSKITFENIVNIYFKDNYNAINEIVNKLNDLDVRGNRYNKHGSL